MFLERVSHALLLCRIQRISVTWTLSDPISDILQKKHIGLLGSVFFCHRILYHVFRIQKRDKYTRTISRNDGTVLYILLSQRIADEPAHIPGSIKTGDSLGQNEKNASQHFHIHVRNLDVALSVSGTVLPSHRFMATAHDGQNDPLLRSTIGNYMGICRDGAP